MTVEEADETYNDCGNNYEDLEYDDDYSNEEERPIFSMDYP